MPKGATSRTMSFLSPKRRRTTGNLKAVNGTVHTRSAEAPPLPSSPTKERPTVTHRPVSQPVVPSSVNGASGSGNGSVGGDGNLFYAYARKVASMTLADVDLELIEA